MLPVPQNARLVKRAYWLVKLRWAAIAALIVGTFCCRYVLTIDLESFALYAIAVLLGLYNLAVLLLLNHFTKRRSEAPGAVVKRIINVQISTDLLILTILLHFSGGIENPFVFYFIFHMIIASILLPVRESYLQATLAILLFGLLLLLEYGQLVPHYCLKGFVQRCLHQDGLFILGTFFVFTTALYLAVYMASYIAIRLKWAEQGYRQANTLLREKDRIKDEYVLRLTHDIKGHLAAIQSCLGVVANKTIEASADRQTDLVNRAHKRTVKLSHFVRELLKLTQMRLSKNLEMSVFSLRNTIDGAVAAAKNKAEDKSIMLNCNIDASADTVFGNEFSIEEMVTNLVLNAIKYTRRDGRVEVNARNNGASVLLEVADTGIGIPQEDLPRVFEEFYRATNAKQFEKEGTGLGLSIVKHIVERHGGQVEVESKEGGGTTFRITLPKEESC